jgi:peptidoglycan/xylan/chitin deacetylase (PgdA/CDA1 family)
MITFDDGYQDFADTAWPILKSHGFSASVFVVAGKAGATADWDAELGAPAPLMDWPTIRAVAAEGAVIGSHSVSHHRLSRLSVEEIYAETLASRTRIAAEIGQAPTTFCYPYGAHDRLIEQVVHESGYELAFSGAPGASTLSDNPLRIPRIEICGADDLTTFSRKVGRPIS